MSQRSHAMSSAGVVLQALNVTLNVLQKHYMDRDLTRSGNSVVMISAGTGVFNVDGSLSGLYAVVSSLSRHGADG